MHFRGECCRNIICLFMLLLSRRVSSETELVGLLETIREMVSNSPAVCNLILGDQYPYICHIANWKLALGSAEINPLSAMVAVMAFISDSKIKLFFFRLIHTHVCKSLHGYKLWILVLENYWQTTLKSLLQSLLDVIINIPEDGRVAFFVFL